MCKAQTPKEVQSAVELIGSLRSTLATVFEFINDELTVEEVENVKDNKKFESNERNWKTLNLLVYTLLSNVLLVTKNNAQRLNSLEGNKPSTHAKEEVKKGEETKEELKQGEETKEESQKKSTSEGIYEEAISKSAQSLRVEKINENDGKLGSAFS